MGSIRARDETGNLVIDFRFRGVRFREQTLLKDTAANRKRLKALLVKVEAEITLDSFDYRRWFPNSKNVAVFDRLCARRALACPRFPQFAELWYEESMIGWSNSHAVTVRQILNQCLLRHFRQYPVDQIAREHVLRFRAELAQGKYSDRRQPPGNKRINKVISILKKIMGEASLRYGFADASAGIKPIKEVSKPIQPFTWPEIVLFLENVRPDFRNYYTVRFLTGLRTGEIDGLRWESIDFERREILVREAIVGGKVVPPKTATSNRAVKMSECVYGALRDQEQASKSCGEYVFCLRSGKPLSHGNVTKRVWYPTLRMLGLKRRNPYQTRHTAASLWMSAGENPEWVARQLGHANTQMLFKVYSRYIPNVTRQDGSAFDRAAAKQLEYRTLEPAD